MEVKDKLIQLWKQCCANEKFEVEKKNNRWVGTTLKISHSNEPKITKKSLDLLEEYGYEFLGIYSSHFDVSALGRSFKFYDKPPLFLVPAFYEASFQLERDYVHLYATETITSKTKLEDSEKKNIFGKPKKYKKQFATRFCHIEPNTRTLYDLVNEDKSEIRHVPYGHVIGETQLVSSIFNMDWGSDDYEALEKKGLKVNNLKRLPLTNDELSDNDKVKDFFCEGKVGIKGALLVFGELRRWLDWDEYSEFLKLYDDSIDKRHMKKLDERLKETK